VRVRPFPHARDDDRDVVVTSTRVREIHHLASSLLGRQRAHQLQDLGLAHEVGEAVRGEHEGVAGPERERLGAEVDLDRGRDPEGAHDFVRVGMGRGLFGLEHARLDHELHHRVIARDLSHRPTRNEVDAAVSDVRHLGAVGSDEHGDHRRARARLAAPRGQRANAGRDPR
jgi:hypothetical protein